MTATVQILKVTHQDVVIKITGAAGDTASVALSDLIPYGPQNYGVGKLTTSTGSDSVIGIGTSFTSDWVGAKLYSTVYDTELLTYTYIGTVDSVDDSETITLTDNAAVDLTAENFFVAWPSQQEVMGGTLRANITGFTWTGQPAGYIEISRNSVVIADLVTDNPNQFDFTGQMMVSDSVENDQDIDVSFVDAAGQLWLRVHKVTGYATRIQPEQFGSHDDPSIITG